jgi:SAM-dependent methyltransferase
VAAVKESPPSSGDTRPASTSSEPAPVRAADSGPDAAPHELAEYIRGFCYNREGDGRYVEQHITRLVRTLEITPHGAENDRILEMGAYLHITPALRTKLGYGEVRGSYLGSPGKVDRRAVVSATGERFECVVDLFNAEKDIYPYPDGYFSTVLCCELLEHLHEDPMHMMCEINRILRSGGRLVLSTPNICSLRAAGAVLLGYHPGFFHQYIRPDADGAVDPRHAREYAPRDVHDLLECSGFEVELLETGPYVARPSLEHEWIRHLLKRYQLPDHLRGEAIFAVGRKTGPVRSRYPSVLYAGGAS